ncbi:MAG: flagellar hook protein FlgE [Clostridia bacterium]|nr:flagellar hook protein FlgE [Clostridia bacterium]
MMRSMYASVSGLRAQQTKMDVIGNNIANVNTIAFRGSRVSFQEVFSQTMKGAGSPDPISGRGGTNPMQVGLGIGVGAVDIITSRGSLQRTDNPTDVSIEGEGFFILKGLQSDSFKFTRAGNFTVDKLGNLVGTGGLKVYGWMDYGGKSKSDGTYDFDVSKPIQPLNLFEDDVNKNKRVIAAQPTSEAILAGNLNAANEIATKAQLWIPISVYDALGNEYKINVEMYKSGIDTSGSSAITEWTWKIPPGSGLNTSDPSGTSTGVSGTIKFNAQGKILDEAAGGTSLRQALTVIPDAAKTGAAPFPMTLDFSKVTMYTAENSIKPTKVDGYPSGSLVTFNIGSDGMITGIYSNGKQQPLALIAMANFENPAGMQRVGENMYIETPNSGEFKRPVKPGTGGAGVLSPGTLEMSNVDLSKEFTEMIVTQRGFQANSRIMTTVDEMLQEMANMKR